MKWSSSAWFHRLLAICGLLSLSTSALAEPVRIYRCQQGDNVTFQQSPCEAEEGDEVKLKGSSTPMTKPSYELKDIHQDQQRSTIKNKIHLQEIEIERMKLRLQEDLANLERVRSNNTGDKNADKNYRFNKKRIQEQFNLELGLAKDRLTSLKEQLKELKTEQ